jgi:hypothetical protein
MNALVVVNLVGHNLITSASGSEINNNKLLLLSEEIKELFYGNLN